MKTIWLTVGLLTAMSVVSAEERYEVTESIDVGAAADKVWEVVGGFDTIDSWHPAITKTEITEGEPTLRGARRTLTIGDGAGSVHETLTAYDQDAMSMSYVINATDIIPVKDYAATIKVLSVSDQLSLIIWSGNFLSRPAEGKTDADSRDFIMDVYKTGLENAKKMIESQ